MITREQVKDLRPGDVVEIRNERWPEGTVARGPIWDDHETLRVADVALRWPDGHPHESPLRTLTVVSRAPRPLYVNHPRTEPVPGDVVRDADDEGRSRVWVHLPHAMFQPDGPWVTQSGNAPIRRGRSYLPDRLRLLVDGETGQVVP